MYVPNAKRWDIQNPVSHFHSETDAQGAVHYTTQLKANSYHPLNRTNGYDHCTVFDTGDIHCRNGHAQYGYVHGILTQKKDSSGRAKNMYDDFIRP